MSNYVTRKNTTILKQAMTMNQIALIFPIGYLRKNSPDYWGRNGEELESGV